MLPPLLIPTKHMHGDLATRDDVETRGGLKRQMKMSYPAWFEGRWHNGKRLKRRLGSIGWKEVSLTKGLKGGDCRWWHYDIIEKRSVFAYGAADTVETAPAFTAGRLTALGRCGAWHHGIFRKWHLMTVCVSVCVCMLAFCAAALENRHTVSVWVLFSSTSFFLIAVHCSIIFSSPLVKPKGQASTSLTKLRTFLSLCYRKI